MYLSEQILIIVWTLPRRIASIPYQEMLSASADSMPKTLLTKLITILQTPRVYVSETRQSQGKGETTRYHSLPLQKTTKTESDISVSNQESDFQQAKYRK
jgi:sucrose-6-phosphate hydrolase SacC (GH32 family)